MTFCRVVTVLWSWHYRLELDGSLIVINTSVGEIIKINTIVVNSAASEISMEREREREWSVYCYESSRILGVLM